MWLKTTTKTVKYSVLLVGLFWVLPIWTYQEDKKAYPDQSHKNTSAQETWITIFVHGMMSIKHHISVENFFRFLRDDINRCTYAKTVDLMRLDPFFYKNQAMLGPGLHQVTPTLEPEGNAAQTMAYLFNVIYNELQPKVQNYYYTFGWSGFLSPSVRYSDAKVFFNALTKEVMKLKNKGINPKIRIIGYSHGGNVTLNLAAIRRRYCPHAPFTVDELILIGMPVQQETDYLVNDPLFLKVYNFYSEGDRVQPMDLFSSKRFFSHRIFSNRPGFCVPSKVTQIELRVKRCRRLSAKTCKAASNWHHPLVCSGRSRLLRDISPGHAEMWFFGWTPLNYRRHFPLYPLPTMALIPFIIQQLKIDTCDPIMVADIRPEFRTILIKKFSGMLCKKITYLSDNKLATLKKELLATAPKHYCEDRYQAHVCRAFYQSHAWQEAEDLINAEQNGCSRKK